MCEQLIVLLNWNYITFEDETEWRSGGAYTDYPVHLDEEYAESLEVQKEEWFHEAAGRKTKEQELSDRVEVVELDAPQLYEEWLQKSTEGMKKGIGKSEGTQFHPLAKRKSKNSFIWKYLLSTFMSSKENVGGNVKKAKQEQRAVTLASWIKEEQIDGVRDCLKMFRRTAECLPMKW